MQPLYNPITGAPSPMMCAYARKNAHEAKMWALQNKGTPKREIERQEKEFRKEESEHGIVEIAVHFLEKLF